MAVATKSKKAPAKAATKTKAAPAKVAEQVVEDELEELEESEATETAPKGKGGAAQEVTFGASDLAAHLSKGRDKPVTAREVRTLIRKMARDGSGRVNREIKAGNRARYDWSGVNDPEVQKIIEAFNNGELEADKQEKLAALKARKAEQTAAKKAAAEAEAGDADEDEVLEDDEDTEGDDE